MFRRAAHRAGMRAKLRVLCNVSAPFTCTHRLYIPWVIAQSEVAPHDMLEQPHSLALNQSLNHVAEYCADSVEALIRLANVRQAEIVKEDLLHNEDGHCLGQFRASLHDP